MKKILRGLFTFMMCIFSCLNITTASSDDIELSTNRKSPSTNQYINLTIEMDDDDYTGKLKFSAKYRSSSSSYFSDYSDEWDDGYYKMTSSDDGEVTLKNLVKFKKKGYYRIYVEDTDDNESYIQFSVDADESNGDLELKVDEDSVDTDDWVKLTIETDDDYTGKINFTKLQYRSSNSSSRSSISRTSSTYVTNYSTYRSNGYYKMTSSDDGEKTISKFIKFKKKGYYRIYAEDTDDNESYVQIYVGNNSSSDDIELTTNRKSPSTSQYINLTIEMDDDDYTGKLYFSAKYRSSSSSSRSSISNLTSSSYFSDYSDEWDDGYYKMTSSDDGEVILKNLVKFKKKGYYRIYVEDTDNNESYIQFSVGVSSDDDDDDVDGFSTTELNKVKNVYGYRNTMIAQMKTQYISLKRDTYRIKLSEHFYDDMEDVINDKDNRDFEDYEDFDEAFQDWYEYSMKNK